MLLLISFTFACRGVVFGTVYGGVIFPPAQAIYFPAPIVAVVVFGPVFAQSVFIGPSGGPNFCDTVFYGDGGRRIYNPCELSLVYLGIAF